MWGQWTLIKVGAGRCTGQGGGGLAMEDRLLWGPENSCAGRQVGHSPSRQHRAVKEPEVNLQSKSIKEIELGRIRHIRNEFNFILRMKCVY